MINVRKIAFFFTMTAWTMTASAELINDQSHRLVGVVAGKRPMAIFMLATEQGGTREVVLEAGDVLGSCIIDTILSEQALLECGDTSVTEVLKSGDYGDISPVSAQWRTVLLDAAPLRHWLQNRQQMLTDVDFSPVVEDGYIVAYQINRIKSGSEGERLGLEPGDTIRAYNNILIKNLGEVVDALKTTGADVNYFTLSVFRSGEMHELTYLLN